MKWLLAIAIVLTAVLVAARMQFGGSGGSDLQAPSNRSGPIASMRSEAESVLSPEVADRSTAMDTGSERAPAERVNIPRASAKLDPQTLEIQLVAFQGEVVPTEVDHKLPSVAVRVQMGPYDAQLSGRPGETLRFQLPTEGEGTASIVDSNSWAPNTMTFRCEKGKGVALTMHLKPRQLIYGRVLDAGTSTPVQSFHITIDTMLTSGPDGSSTFAGSPRLHANEKGRFAYLPYQKGTRHRLTFMANGYEPLKTDWFDVNDEGRADLGELFLEPRYVAQVSVLVVAANTGSPVPDAAIYVSKEPIDNRSLDFEGGFVGSNRFLERGQTNEAGVFTFEAQVGVPLHLVVNTNDLERARQSLIVNDIQPMTVEIPMQSGSAVECRALVPEWMQATIKKRRVEIQIGDREFYAYAITNPDTGEDFARIGGLPAGPAHVQFTADFSLGDGVQQDVTLASRTIDVDPLSETQIWFDLSFPADEGIEGHVRLPIGHAQRAPVAEWYASQQDLFPTRGIGVVNDRFFLPCNSDNGLIVVHGTAADFVTKYVWFAPTSKIDPSRMVEVDLGRTEVVIGFAPGVQRGFEVLVVSPAEGHPLFGAPGTSVRDMMSADDEFRVFGLPDGPYAVETTYSKWHATFTINGPGRIELTIVDER